MIRKSYIAEIDWPERKTETMKTKEEIVQNWLPRYTGQPLENFGKYILLTNFSNYVEWFAKWHKVEVEGRSPGRELF